MDYVNSASAPPMSAAPTVIITAPTPVGREGTHLRCPKCRSEIVTRVQYVNSSKTHVTAILLCAFVGCLGCCLIPYCMNSCKNADHYCPNCQTFIGSYKR